jgi:hypothetical protein
MALRGYRFSRMDGQITSDRRGVGFLEEIVDEGEESSLDAKSKFGSLLAKRDRDVRSRVDYWISGAPPNDRWFHGWPNDHEVRDCFCFRWNERTQHHRLYGFMCNPQPKTCARFQLCVLTYHDVKNDGSTDRTLLLRSMKLSGNALVRGAISLEFPDDVKEKGKAQ